MAKVAPIGKHMEARNLELNLLRTFLAVVQHGSMGKTAAAARVTQPAVSAQVFRLEKLVGHRLFTRVPWRVAHRICKSRCGSQ